ncbi:MAG: hypothetical protein GWO22_11145, partial [Actinobacteria bacterium]|nr:hypothetical protein [Actinomycetota bacterium]
ERTLTGAFGILSAGYVLPLPDRWLLYPFAGIGGGGLSLTTRELEQVTFNEV